MPGPTLKQLLAADERQRRAERRGSRATARLVTLLGARSVPVRQRDVNSAYDDTIAQADGGARQGAGARAGGRAHRRSADRSLRYQDNFELSRERAVSVVTLLQKGLDNPARLTWTGVGISQPRYRPGSDPENRARNRRVEIIHVRGT